MIAYLDTSALVPLLVSEPTSAACGELWDAADRVVSTRLTYVEAAAALAMAQRLGRITPAHRSRSARGLDQLWSGIDIVELDHDLMSAAATMAVAHRLRAYDATHCAAAISIDSDEVVAATGDARLRDAWQAEGLAVRDTTIA